MNERQARDVTLLEAFETAQPPHPAWGEADRAWADRVALEAAGSDASAGEFAAQRARHALQRLLEREPRVARWLGGPVSMARRGAIVGGIAFAFGLFVDRLDPGQRINLLAPPLWGVVAWNLAVYVLAAGFGIAALLRRESSAPGPVVRVARWLLRADAPVPSAGGVNSGPWLRYVALWPARHGALSALRVQALLHVGAAALALGMIASLYARGLVLDYRAAWESTFLTPSAAHAVVTTLLAPAAALSGIALPDAATFASLRAAHARSGAGAPAAPWIHLLAVTLVLAVVLPRLLLAAACFARAGWQARRFRLPLSEAYFLRLARLQRGGTARVEVWPYAHTPTPQGALALQALCAGAFGHRAGVRIAPTVAFGAEGDEPLRPSPGTTHLVALFDLGATPEAESQGRFVQHLAAALSPGLALAVVVDEAAFRARFGSLGERLGQRRQAWSSWGEALGTVPCFVDLEAAATPQAARAFEAAFVAPAPATS